MHIVRRCLLGLALVVSWVGSLHAGHPYVHVRYGYGYGYHGYFPIMHPTAISDGLIDPMPIRAIP